MPATASSLALLKLLGIAPDESPMTPNPDEAAGLDAMSHDAMGADDPLALRTLRDQQASELGHNLDIEKGAPHVSAGAMPWQTTGRSLVSPSQPGLSSFMSGGTPADLSELKKDAEQDPLTGTDAQDLASFFDPQQTRRRDAEQASKMALAAAPADAAARGNLAVEQAKAKGAVDLMNAEQGPAREYLARMGAGGSNGGMGGGANGMTMKPSINAKGQISFTGTPTMPALVQRAHSQLVAAREQTLNALNDAENLYPGINDSATGVDNQHGSQSWWDTLTGGGAKYGNATDLLSAGNERLKYTMGVPTPFAKLAQEASFANLEQMAGQLPGVRGLATITPLFKEHQSRWGKETPVQTVQRLRHMASIMDETLQEIEGGDTSAMTAQSLALPPQPPLGPMGAQ